MIFYHLTSHEFEKGDVITPQKSGYVWMDESRAMEEVLEMFRPDNKLSRYDSVFLSSSSNNSSDMGAEGSTYIVACKVSNSIKENKSDMNWLSEIDQGFDDINILLEDYDINQLKVLAEGYWSGTIRNNKRPQFEYRAPKAEVVLIRENALEISYDTGLSM